MGGERHDVAAWGSKKARGVTIRMERGRVVAVNAGDDVDRVLELVNVFAPAPRRKYVVGEIVPHSVARVDHD